MDKAALGSLRRCGAIVLFRIASAIMRIATKLYRRRTISAAQLRAALTAARLLERAGALLVMGRRRRMDRQLFEKEGDNDRTD